MSEDSGEEDMIPTKDIIKTKKSILNDNFEEEECNSEELRGYYYSKFIGKKQKSKEEIVEKTKPDFGLKTKVKFQEEQAPFLKKKNKIPIKATHLKNKLGKLRNELIETQNEMENKIKFAESQYSIQNMELLEKVFPSFLEYVALNWEEITHLLIEDLLYELVGILN